MFPAEEKERPLYKAVRRPRVHSCSFMAGNKGK